MVRRNRRVSRDLLIGLFIGFCLGYLACFYLPIRTAEAREPEQALTLEQRVAALEQRMGTAERDVDAVEGVNTSQWHRMAELGVAIGQDVTASLEIRAQAQQARTEAYAALAEVQARMEAVAWAKAGDRLQQWKEQSAAYVDRFLYDQIFLRDSVHTCRELRRDVMLRPERCAALGIP